MTGMRTAHGKAAVGLLLAAWACGDALDGAAERPLLRFVPSVVGLSQARETTLTLENVGAGAAQGVTLRWDDVDGLQGMGATLAVSPSSVTTLGGGGSLAVTINLGIPAVVAAGTYRVILVADLGSTAAATAKISFQVMATPSGTMTVSGPASARQGDVVTYGAEVRDASGTVVTNSTIVWSVSPLGAGFVAADGRFVAYQPGAARVIGRAGSLADSVTVVIQPRGLGGSFTVEGQGTIVDRFTSDLWVHGAAAYTGTWSTRTEPGNTVYVWRIDDPTQPTLTDSLRLDASTVNDVKVRSDGTVGVATHEGSSDGLNGITLLDLADPLHPAVISRYTSGLESGVHNVWIDGDYVYVAPDGVNVGLRIVDISDPNNPTEAAQFMGGASFLHDVYVRDGLAFLSHWNDGLVIVDVGNGIASGSPSSPTEVSRIATIGGQTHNAWYWPAAGYVFVGEEDFGAPGILHVVDVRDLRQPQEVATYAVPGGPPHNFWLDEAGGVLYAAWYGQGLRGVDVSGELLGRLELQGRDIASSLYGGSGACPSATGSFTCTWAPQLEAGLVFVSDMNTGLTVLRPQF
jgi:hypothetical protein